MSEELVTLRALLSELPLTDAQLEPFGPLLNRVEEQITSGSTALLCVQSLQVFVEMRFFKRGDECPFCHQHGRHTEACYLRSSTGWNLLNEHEAVVRENDELRAALAKHLPHNGMLIRPGRMSLRDRACSRKPPRD